MAVAISFTELMSEVNSGAYSKQQIVKRQPTSLYSGENNFISNNQNPPQHLDWSGKEKYISYFEFADDS